MDAIVNEDKIDSFDSRPNNMSIEDKHLLSRLLLLLNPNYSNLAGGGGGGGRNRRPSRRKKPIINVIEGMDQGNQSCNDIIYCTIFPFLAYCKKHPLNHFMIRLYIL